MKEEKHPNIIESLSSESNPQGESEKASMKVTLNTKGLREAQSAKNNYEVYQALASCGENQEKDPLSGVAAFLIELIDLNRESKVEGVAELITYYLQSGTVELEYFSCNCWRGNRLGNLLRTGTNSICIGSCRR